MVGLGSILGKVDKVIRSEGVGDRIRGSVHVLVNLGVGSGMEMRGDEVRKEWHELEWKGVDDVDDGLIEEQEGCGREGASCR